MHVVRLVIAPPNHPNCDLGQPDLECDEDLLLPPVQGPLVPLVGLLDWHGVVGEALVVGHVSAQLVLS